MFVVLSLKKLLFWLLLAGIVLLAVYCIANAPNSGAQPAVSYDLGELPMLIIDPGHGGVDGGAVSVNGVNESVINLDIAKKMELMCEFMGFPVLMTRKSEELDYPDDCTTIAARKRHDQKSRVAFINAAENAVVLSIHQNSFPNSKPYGPQSFYTNDEAAQSLATLVQDCLNEALCPEKRRVAAPVAKSIYLMKSIDYPGVLVECGFVSNKREAALLETEEYRLKIACAVMGAYSQHIFTEDEIG